MRLIDLRPLSEAYNGRGDEEEEEYGREDDPEVVEGLYVEELDELDDR